MNTQTPPAQTAPPRPPPIVGSPEERRASVYEGMASALDDVVARHPHVRYGFLSESPEIDRANRELAAAVNRFISGEYAMRSQVRPYFDRAVAAYLKAADAVVLLLTATLNAAVARAIADHPYMDLAQESEEIDAAARAFARERDAMLAGDCDPEALHRALFELVAAHCDAATPEDLATEPTEEAA